MANNSIHNFNCLGYEENFTDKFDESLNVNYIKILTDCFFLKS
jgi:hypothetical protein